jgi:hypothetical protein
MKLIAILFSAILLCSCATTMPGKDLTLNTTSLRATIDENSNFSNQKIKMYQISIKNLTDTWVEIDSANLIDSSNSINVLMGSKLNSWIEACNLEKRVSNYNTALFLGAVAAAGAVVGSTANNNSTSTVASSIALGAIGAAGVKGMIDSKNKVEFQMAFPDGHLFRPFMLPPLKVIQRWLLIENPNEENLQFSMVSKNKDIGTVSFEIKKEKPPVLESGLIDPTAPKK